MQGQYFVSDVTLTRSSDQYYPTAYGDYGRVLIEAIRELRPFPVDGIVAIDRIAVTWSEVSKVSVDGRRATSWRFELDWLLVVALYS